MNRFSPIIITSSLAHSEHLRSLGATHIIDRALPDAEVLAEVQRTAGGAPVAYAFDAIGTAATQELAFDALAAGGAYVSVMPQPSRVSPRVTDGVDGKRVARPYASPALPANRALGVEVYARLTGWLADGTIQASASCWTASFCGFS